MALVPAVPRFPTILALASLSCASGLSHGTRADSDAAGYASLRARTIARGAEVLGLLRRGRIDRLAGQFTREMSRAVPPSTIAVVLRNVGAIGPARNEGAILRSRRERSYIAEVDAGAGPTTVTAAFDDHDRISGLLLRPAPPRFPAPSAPPVELSLPFDGAWVVGWGGETAAHNYHVAARPQRFALDLEIWRAGGTHRGEGTHNEDHWAWGEAILAPGDGTVVAAVDGMPDNVPGVLPQLATSEAAGNHVILEVAPRTYVFLAHFQRGSVAVRTGARVRAGDRLGLCGNSGRSSEPHLHMHVQDSPTLSRGDGLPLVFKDAVVDGARTERAVPRQGQLLSR
jgi:murein DD-endopeptidase MepM/ murein hydrolase activator NlpD